MEAKYLFILLNIILILGYIFTLVFASRTEIIAQWDQRRCDFDVMTTAFLYKPIDDTRSLSDFSTDNFNYCISFKSKKNLNTKFNLSFKELKYNIDLSNSLNDVFNTLRETIKSTIFDPFSAMIQGFLSKFMNAGFLASRIFQTLFMAMKRAGAIAIASVFMIISLQTAFMNSIDFIINVIMIVLYILMGLSVIFCLPILPF